MWQPIEPGLRAEVAQLMSDAWREPGFCVPNATTYPHQWLWDSCFHAVIWDALDDDRGWIELANVLANQDESGFVPHMTYWHHPTLHQSFWGRPTTSIITQPPMYGHAYRRLWLGAGRQRQPDDGLSEQVARGLGHLLFDRPRTPGGLVPVLHPWETGCDDSPRWDGHRHRAERWRTTKGNLVAALRPDAPAGLARFEVGSIGFNALLAWNTREYLATPDAHDRQVLGPAAETLANAVAARWDETASTWLDDHGPTAAAEGHPASAVRTADTMLALLVDPRPEGFDQLVDPAAFGAPYGPRGVHRAESVYEPDVYWRGPAWPQIGYLLWLAAIAFAGSGSEGGFEGAADQSVAISLATALVGGAQTSGLAEYWHPETGRGLGARPQTWAGLALLAAQWLDQRAHP